MSHRTLSPALGALLIASVFGLLAGVFGCTGGNEYRAEIRRTDYGIPHIEAADIGSLGFGEGYAQAQDHLCSIADQVVKARGERAKFFGRGERDRHLQSDLAMKALDIHGGSAAELERQPQEIRDWYDGYVAGYNKLLADTGKEQIGGWCRGADWVFPITVADLAAYHRLVTLVSTRFGAMIASAQPPAEDGAATAGAVADLVDEGILQDDMAEATTLGASNGWALGSDRSESGRGMLIANPHYPWVGSNRFWEKQLTIPGELDVYGVGLIGIPGVAIGFNRAVAWTHTVSAGTRFTLYALELVPGHPTRYRYDDTERDMTSQTIQVEVRGDDGQIETVERTLWSSHYGPIVNLPGVGWTAERAVALRDANQDNDEGRQQWLAMDRASTFEEFQDAHRRLTGMPWVNTIAASAEGEAWYIDTSATPNLSDEALARFAEMRAKNPLVASLYQRGMVLLDGSDSTFEWVDDPQARDPGVLPYDELPQLERRDYVFNANDSYWLANSSELVTGFSPLQGGEKTPRSLRTRNNDWTLSLRSSDQPAGDNRKFNLDELGNAILSNRSLTAELLKDELVERCRKTPAARLDGRRVDLAAACDLLAGWNDRLDLDAPGAVLFREWIGQYEPVDLRDQGKLFAVAFDPADPVQTPRGLASGSLALENLARAVRLLESREIALDATLGELQYADKAGRHIPIHGGDGAYEGVLNMQRNSTNTTTLEPMDNPERVEGSRFLTVEGYPVVHGSSFLMALEFTDQGPHAKAFLTYSESGDPESPHFTDQTELFSRKEWRPILFEEDEIAGAVVEAITVTGPRPPAG